uniref:Uncharacterized protein n=1 Tax=Parascaris univalens TaxID=6257 RepID=A0A915BAY6_PARUN
MNVPLTLVLFFISLHSAINRSSRHYATSTNDTIVEAENDLPLGERKELRELSREEISEMIESFENIRRPRAHLGASLLQEIDQKSSSKEELIFRLEEALNLTLPYWDFELDRRLANPIDSVLLHSDFLKKKHSHGSVDVVRILDNYTDDSTENIANILDEQEAAKRNEAFLLLRRNNFTQFFYILLEVAKISGYGSSQNCDRCPPTNQWLFCDSWRMHCVSKVVINGNCSTFNTTNNVCHKSDCIDGKCSSPPATSSTPITVDNDLKAASYPPTHIFKDQASSRRDASDVVETIHNADKLGNSLVPAVAISAEVHPRKTIHAIQNDLTEQYTILPRQTILNAITPKFSDEKWKKASTDSWFATSQPENAKLPIPATTAEVLQSKSVQSRKQVSEKMSFVHEVSSSRSPIQVSESERITPTESSATSSSVIISTISQRNKSTGYLEPTPMTSSQHSSEIFTTEATATLKKQLPTVPVAHILDGETESFSASSRLGNVSHREGAASLKVYKLLASTASGAYYSSSTTHSPPQTTTSGPPAEPSASEGVNSTPHEEDRKTSLPPTLTEPTEMFLSQTATQTTQSSRQLFPAVGSAKVRNDRREADTTNNGSTDSIDGRADEKTKASEANADQRYFVTSSSLPDPTTTTQPLIPTTRTSRKRTKKPGRRKNKTRPQSANQRTRKLQTTASTTSRIVALPSTSTSATKLAGESQMRNPIRGPTAPQDVSIHWRSGPSAVRNPPPPREESQPEDGGTTPIVYFSITIIEGEPRRKSFLNRRLEHCEITVTGLNMPSGYTQTTHGRLVPGTTIGLVHTLDPELHAPLVEFRITVTDRIGRECEQRCLNEKGSYERCDRNSVRLTSHEFIAFADPIETHESEEDVLKNQWSGRGYYRKRKKDYLLFACAKS